MSPIHQAALICSVASTSIFSMSEESISAMSHFVSGSDAIPMLGNYADYSEKDLIKLKGIIQNDLNAEKPINSWACIALSIAQNHSIRDVIKAILINRGAYVQAFIDRDPNKQTDIKQRGIFPVQFLNHYNPVPHGAAWGYRPTDPYEFWQAHDLSEIQSFLEKDPVDLAIDLAAMQALNAPLNYTLIAAHLFNRTYGNKARQVIENTITARRRYYSSLLKLSQQPIFPKCNDALYLDQLLNDHDFKESVNSQQPITPFVQIIDVPISDRRQDFWNVYQYTFLDAEKFKIEIQQKNGYPLKNSALVAYMLLGERGWLKKTFDSSLARQHCILCARVQEPMTTSHISPNIAPETIFYSGK